MQELLLGEGSAILAEQRAVTLQTPGGTGALRLAADLLHQKFPQTSVWLSEPTWANHGKIFAAAGVDVHTYPYYDADTGQLAFAPMLEALHAMPAGDVVLLHGCCHNPTGVDPTREQWRELAAAIQSRGLLPLVDFAYQGLGSGLREDARSLEILCAAGSDVMIASSYSKNFGLYNERVGALTLIATHADAALAARSQAKIAARASYSNPPAHGSAVVTEILTDAELRGEWEREVENMRDRIRAMRQLLVATLKAKGAPRDFSFMTRQQGMFSFSGLTGEQGVRLRDEYAIYMVASGRINVAGLNTENVDRVATAVAAVL